MDGNGENMERITKRQDWPLLFTIGGSALTIAATCVGLWLHSDSKFCAFQATMYQELQDFHGRLCTLEEKYHQSERG